MDSGFKSGTGRRNDPSGTGDCRVRSMARARLGLWACATNRTGTATRAPAVVGRAAAGPPDQGFQASGLDPAGIESARLADRRHTQRSAFEASLKAFRF